MQTRGGTIGTLTPGQNIYEASATQKHKLGERLPLGDRVFHYALAGAVALVAGEVQSAVCALKTEDTVTVAHAIGDFTVDVTAANVVANQYAGGYLTVDEGTGAGTTYKIRSNDATGGAAGSGKIRCVLYDPLVAAWSTSDTDVTLVESPYWKVVVNPTAGTSMPVGVPLVAVAINYYCWLQTWGPCGVFIDAGSGGGAAKDERWCAPSANHAGYVEMHDTPVNQNAVIGQPLIAAADHTDNKVEPIFLMIAP